MLFLCARNLESFNNTLIDDIIIINGDVEVVVACFNLLKKQEY